MSFPAPPSGPSTEPARDRADELAPSAPVPGSPSSAAAHELVKPLIQGRRAARIPVKLERGDTIDRYVILATLGHGGMGVVYAAYDPELDRKIALKLLRPRDNDTSDNAARTRLLREAQALAKLAHPNVVAVYDAGVQEDQVWIAMEYVPGETLSVWAQRQARSWSEVLSALCDAAHGVVAAHAAGLVHRDLKPDNVMIGSDGRVRVMDFGLVRERELSIDEQRISTTLAAESSIRPRVPALAQRLTQGGALQGTMNYMAPEQWDAKDVEAPADQFGWCVMAWELLYGELPYSGDTPMTLAANVVLGNRKTPPRTRHVPVWLRRVLERGLSVDPSQRWPSMADLLAALKREKTMGRVKKATTLLLSVMAIGMVMEGYRRHEHAQRVAACAEAGLEIRAVWNDDKRRQLRDAFAATDLGYALATAERVEPRFDKQATMWTHARESACLNSEVYERWSSDILDQALWCLEDRRVEFDALISEMTRADATVVTKAISASAGLAAATPCIDDEYLKRQPTPPPSGGEVLRLLRSKIVRAGSLGLAGKPLEGLDLATSTRISAEEFSWPPLVASARFREGRLMRDLARSEDAEVALKDAYHYAVRSGAWDVAADSAAELVFTVGYRLARAKDGYEWFRHAESALVWSGDHERLREANNLSALGNVQYLAGDFKSSQDTHARALEIRERVLGSEHPDVARSLSNLANAYDEDGEHDIALPLFARAATLSKKALGPEHPDYAAILSNLAGAYFYAGDYENARSGFEEAIAVWKNALGPKHLDLAAGFDNLANVYGAIGDYSKSKALHEQGLSIREDALGSDHPDVATSLHNLANELALMGAEGDAKVFYERALAIRIKAHGEEHPDVAASLSSLAKVVDSPAQQRALYERGLAITEKLLGPNHPDVAIILHNLATSESPMGRRSRELLERAVLIKENSLGPDHPAVAFSLTVLAPLYIEEKRPEETLRLLERAVRIFDAHDGTQKGEALAHFNLAKALVSMRGDLIRAQSEAENALAQYRDEGEIMADQAKEVEAWLGSHARQRRPR